MAAVERPRPELAVREALLEGYTLQSDWYTDPRVLELEEQRLFSRIWQYAGDARAVAEPGAYFTCSLGRMPVVVACDDDGALHAFANVCRHRGMIVAGEGSGHCKLFQCPYHGWTYQLDGSLNRAPGFDRDPDFDRASFGLVELKADVWGPFVFVNRDLEAAPLSKYLHPLEDRLAEAGLDMNGLVFYRRDEYAIEANWKVVVENSLECYHCGPAHPSLAAITDLKHFTVTNYDRISCQTAPTKEGNDEAGYSATGGVIPHGVWTHVWPNSELSMNPGPENLSARVFVPVSHDRTLAIYDNYLAEGHSPVEERVSNFADEVATQDVALCEGVQRGLRSGAYTRGPLNLTQLPNEVGIAWWESLYTEVLAHGTGTRD